MRYTKTNLLGLPPGTRYCPVLHRHCSPRRIVQTHEQWTVTALEGATHNHEHTTAGAGSVALIRARQQQEAATTNASFRLKAIHIQKFSVVRTLHDNAPLVTTRQTRGLWPPKCAYVWPNGSSCKTVAAPNTAFLPLSTTRPDVSTAPQHSRRLRSGQPVR